MDLVYINSYLLPIQLYYLSLTVRVSSSSVRTFVAITKRFEMAGGQGYCLTLGDHDETIDRPSHVHMDKKWKELFYLQACFVGCAAMDVGELRRFKSLLIRWWNDDVEVVKWRRSDATLYGARCPG